MVQKIHTVHGHPIVNYCGQHFDYVKIGKFPLRIVNVTNDFNKPRITAIFEKKNLKKKAKEIFHVEPSGPF